MQTNTNITSFHHHAIIIITTTTTTAAIIVIIPEQSGSVALIHSDVSRAVGRSLRMTAIDWFINDRLKAPISAISPPIETVSLRQLAPGPVDDVDNQAAPGGSRRSTC